MVESMNENKSFLMYSKKKKQTKENVGVLLTGLI